jgi:hypothetical protein
MLKNLIFNVLLKSLGTKKVYLAAAGLAGLAVYQLSQGDVNAATQSFLAALAAAGLKHELS